MFKKFILMMFALNLTAFADYESAKKSHKSPHACFRPIVEGYWESWCHATTPSTIAHMPCDVVNVAFVNVIALPTGEYKVVSLYSHPEKIKKFVKAAHKTGKKVKVSYILGSFPFSTSLQSEEVDAVSLALATYIQEHKMDGIDLCIFRSHPANVEASLIERLRAHLGQSAHISYTTKAISAVPSPCDEVLTVAHSYLDTITVPTFDLGDAYNYRGVVHKLAKFGIPLRKIVIGVMPGSDHEGRWTSLNDLKQIAHFVKRRGLGGIAYWSMNRDHTNLTDLGEDAVANSLSTIFSDCSILPVEPTEVDFD